MALVLDFRQALTAIPKQLMKYLKKQNKKLNNSQRKRENSKALLGGESPKCYTNPH